MEKISVKCIALVLIVAIVVGAVVWYVKPAPPSVELPGKGLRFDFVTNGSPGDPYWAVVKKGVDDAAALLGVEAHFHFAPGDIPKQVEHFEEAIAAGADGICCCVVDLEAFDDCFQEAIDKGIAVAQFVCADEEWIEKGVPYIGFSLYESGRMLAQYFVEHELIKDGDDVLISAEVWASYAVDRREGFLDVLNETGITVNVHLLETTDDMATAEARITEFLAAHPEIEVAMGCGGITTERTTVSVQSVGKEPGEIKVGGFDLLPETVEGIKNGYCQVSVMGQQYLNGFYAVLSLYHQAKYEFEMPNVSFGWACVDSTNIADVEKYIEQHIK